MPGTISRCSKTILGSSKNKLGFALVTATALVTVFSCAASSVPHVFTVSEPELVAPYAFVFDRGQIPDNKDRTVIPRKPTLLVATGGGFTGDRIVELNAKGHTRVVMGQGANGEAVHIGEISKAGFSMFPNGDLLVVGRDAISPIPGRIFRVNRKNGKVQCLLYGDQDSAVVVDPTENNSFYYDLHGRIYKAKINEDGSVNSRAVAGGGHADPVDMSRPGTEVDIPTPFTFSIDRDGKLLVATSSVNVYNWVAELGRTGRLTLVKRYPRLNNVSAPISAVRLANGSIAVSIYVTNSSGIGIELLKSVPIDGGSIQTSEWLVSPASQKQGNAIPANELKLNSPRGVLYPAPDGGLFVDTLVDGQLVMRSAMRYIEPETRTDEERAQLAQLNPVLAAKALTLNRAAVLSLAHDHWVQGTPLQRVPRDARQIIGEHALANHHEQWWKTLISRWVPRACN